MGKPSGRRLGFRSRLVLFAALAGGLLALYLTRPDAAQAVHWWPMAVWTPVVFLPFLAFRFRPIVRPFFVALVLWILAVHLVREPSFLVLAPVRRRAVTAFRIVSLNCAGGTTAAAQEAFAQSADLVLLQEVGGREEFVRAGKAKGYRYVSWSFDDAVFSTRPLTGLDHGPDYAAGSVILKGRPIRIVALRLLPPVFRLDLWSPDCWRTYAEDAIARRSRMRALLPKEACLVGGDFNATNPRLVTDSRPEMTEAGRTVGHGWRGTGTNDFPVVWTDQIWASPEVEWVQSFVVKTENSDHRMVIADFELR